MVCIPDSYQIFSSAAHGFDRKLVDHKDHDVFLINGSGRNIRYKGRKRVYFYLIEPLRDRLVAKLDADNFSGICNTDKNMPALCIGESGKRFNRRLIEGGFELDRFGFAFFMKSRMFSSFIFYFLTAFLMRLTWRRPRPFTSQPSSK